MAYHVKGFTYAIENMTPRDRRIMYDLLTEQKEFELNEMKRKTAAKKARR